MNHLAKPAKPTKAAEDPAQKRLAASASDRVRNKPRAVNLEIVAAELRATERERTRISQELHDGLGQHLTGIAFLSKALANRLGEQGLAESAEARRIAELVNQAVADAQALARGLQPVGSEDNALWAALGRLAADVAGVCGIDCTFNADGSILIASSSASHHLYRIAQEAVHNAIKHGSPGPITIDLQETPKAVMLSVTNSGCLDKPGRSNGGLGVGSMRERARLIGARLTLDNLGDRRVRLRVMIRRDLANATQSLQGSEIDSESR